MFKHREIFYLYEQQTKFKPFLVYVYNDLNRVGHFYSYAETQEEFEADCINYRDTKKVSYG